MTAFAIRVLASLAIVAVTARSLWLQLPTLTDLSSWCFAGTKVCTVAVLLLLLWWRHPPPRDLGRR
ncbi:hypothetical protein FIM10_18620 [Sphingomonadales bacterium 56]|uniref:Uncharacterized protein n=1 Tax=Sphingobium indicum TaxID=332055 RepID=A0A4Q4ITB4_9SPHN|nr:MULTISPECIES: hypothetical protein [Sphingobium]MBY2930697.1 hypothetical protein [Sphingomonadales bacterium 56]MBY2960761.1 hypothetical protein [Sphingomonadales bacterium 58]NYI25001.1 hypothetical protein [Sphingobium indicum]RYL96723.1 hypothetical protein EWH08_19580 [Sphingobium indicum]CAD7341777.1 hypothetical protein SPHS6_03748 [Sphingobium sp. S6]